MEMRYAQFEIIKRMKKHFSRFYMTYSQTELLAEYTYKVAFNIHRDNDCRDLINELNMLRDEYRKMELPKNREEFENRALLLQFLNDLEDFLLLKKTFKDNYYILFWLFFYFLQSAFLLVQRFLFHHLEYCVI